jgi:hypothetical protein
MWQDLCTGSDLECGGDGKPPRNKSPGGGDGKPPLNISLSGGTTHVALSLENSKQLSCD